MILFGKMGMALPGMSGKMTVLPWELPLRVLLHWGVTLLPPPTLPHQLGPSPHSLLASETYRITENKVYREGAFSWDPAGLPLFSHVRSPTSPRTLRSRSHQLGPSLVSQTLVAYLVTAQWLTGLHPKNLIS